MISLVNYVGMECGTCALGVSCIYDSIRITLMEKLMGVSFDEFSDSIILTWQALKRWLLSWLLHKKERLYQLTLIRKETLLTFRLDALVFRNFGDISTRCSSLLHMQVGCENWDRYYPN